MTGQEYRDRREAKGLTRLQLSALLEIDPSTIQAREARGADAVTKEHELALLRVTRDLPDAVETVVVDGVATAFSGPPDEGEGEGG